MANDNRATYTSTTGSLIMIAILVLSAINVSRKTSQVLAPLESFKKTFYNDTENIDKYLKEDYDEEEINLYHELLNGTLIPKIQELLDKQRTYQLVILVFSCIVVGFGIIALIILLISFISKKVASIILVAIAIVVSFTPLIILILSALSLKKDKKINQFDLTAWKGMGGYKELDDFNDYISGFRGRNIAIVVLSAISVASGVLTICCVILIICAS